MTDGLQKKQPRIINYPAVVAWSVKASTQIQVELDYADGGLNPAWDRNLYKFESLNKKLSSTIHG